MNKKPTQKPYTLSSRTESQPHDQNLSKSMPLPTLTEEKVRPHNKKIKTIKIKTENWEEKYYSEMEDISRIQTAHFTAQKMFRAIELNDVPEFKRLHGLDAEQGGLLLWRFSAQNRNGKSFLDLAEEMGRTEIVNFLKNK